MALGGPIFCHTDYEHSLRVSVLDACTKDFHHALGPIVECEPWESHAYLQFAMECHLYEFRGLGH